MSKNNMDWWTSSRLGMFIHWGIYSSDKLSSCWAMHDMGIPIEEYVRTYEPGFTAKKYDPEQWMQMAKDAGCKYVVMGARHHEGYCLWNTDTTNYSSVYMTPKRDLIGEYARAARSKGLRVGIYYSLLDWRYKAYWDGPKKSPDAWKAFVDYCHAQVKELMSNYGKIDILWYDGAGQDAIKWWGFKASQEDFAAAWRSKELNAMVRKLQPGILINNRIFLPEDFGTPEQKVEAEPRPWELCDTLGELWGASPADINRKTPREVITRLIKCVSHGGNMLINIGPKADGSIQKWQKKILLEVGRWVHKHQEAIYGCTGEPRWPYNVELAPWHSTRKKNNIYLHLLRYPGQQYFAIANIHGDRIISAELLDTGQKLEIKHEPTRDVICGLPPKSPDPMVSVIKLKVRPMNAKELQKRGHFAVPDPDKMLGLSKE